jgi:hypothetical protein
VAADGLTGRRGVAGHGDGAVSNVGLKHRRVVSPTPRPIDPRAPSEAGASSALEANGD